ncbi:MAG TPA: hypothetical protein VFZ18_07875 [Longimicrobiaceae bacterium]|jgi:hypothetical protein
MITTLLAILALAALFVTFGWSGAADAGGHGCSGCHHPGVTECGSSCPLLKDGPHVHDRSAP